MAQQGKKSAPGAGKRKKSAVGSARAVSAARNSSSNRNQLLIGGLAVLVIIGIITYGIISTANKTAIQGSGYGVSNASTASYEDGIIAVSNGDPDLIIDIYEDAICPACAMFEEQYGQQIAKAVDDGDVTVRFRMVDFLNAASFSGDYSTRAFAALAAVAKHDGGEPGRLMEFHAALFDQANQPREGGQSDLTNGELAALAASIGASQEAQDEISSGSFVGQVAAQAGKNMTSLRDVSGKADMTPGTPGVAIDGVRISTDSTDWLTSRIAG